MKHKKNHHKRSKSRSRSKHKKHSKKKENPEEKLIEIENKMIDQQLQQELELEKKRKEREQILQKYRQEEPIQQEQDPDSQSEQHQAQEVDQERLNLLKQLEQQRDQMKQQQQIEVKKKKNVLDMFADDDEEESQEDNAQTRTIQSSDENGYYRINIGEIINDKYKVISKSGQGVFSNVLKAQTLDGKEVAIKMLRNEEIYLRSGERERVILKKLNENDPEDKTHVIRMLDTFEHHKHLCLVFEIMETNLRDYMKNKGLELEQIKTFAINLFKALSFLRKQRLIHADIKPDNILISNNQVKLCDFGTAFTVDESTLVDYLQSRFYRAPEIIIGYPYDTQLDVWSTACTLFELYTGKFLFDGPNNNEMLKMQIQTIGKFSLKMLSRGAFIHQYFDQNFTFLQKEIDPITKQEYRKPVLLGEKPIRSIISMLRAKDPNQDIKKLNQFKDLLERCLQLDPKNRILPEEALQHPFLKN